MNTNKRRICLAVGALFFFAIGYFSFSYLFPKHTNGDVAGVPNTSDDSEVAEVAPEESVPNAEEVEPEQTVEPSPTSETPTAPVTEHKTESPATPATSSQQPTPPEPPKPTQPTPPAAPTYTKCSNNSYGATNVNMSNQILDLVNTARKESGAGTLNCKDALIPLAEIRAKEIVQLFSHTRPNGQPWYTTNPGLVNGENLAIGYGTAQAVFDAWMASPGHRENILRPEFKSMGVAYYYSTEVANVPAEHCPDNDNNPNNQETECDAKYHHYIAQVFSVAD